MLCQFVQCGVHVLILRDVHSSNAKLLTYERRFWNRLRWLGFKDYPCVITFGPLGEAGLGSLFKIRLLLSSSQFLQKKREGNKAKEHNVPYQGANYR